jgi:hydrogenase maturation protease
VRIIACGNPGRGDDGAGWLVVDRLRELGIEALGVRTTACTGEITGLLNELHSDEDVILLDAVVTGAPAGTVHRWDGIPPASLRYSSSTHGLGVAEALRLALALGRVPKSVQFYGIEGKQFEPCSSPSPRVKQAAESLAQQIQTTIRAEQAPK